jgi:tetratricopeptide (TPR) repeat protein
LGRLDEGIRLTDEGTEWALEHRLYMPALAGIHNGCQLRAVALRGREGWARLQGLSDEHKALLRLEIHRVEAMLLSFIGAPAEVLRAAEQAALTAAAGDIARLAFTRATALVKLDRAEEALEVLRPIVGDAGAQHAKLHAWLLAGMATGATAEAASDARQVLALQVAFPMWVTVAEAAVEAMVAAGQQRIAYEALRERRGEADGSNPWWRLAWARLELESDSRAAQSSSAAAAARFEDAGYPWDAGRANLVLAEAMLAVGDHDEARTTLHRVLVNAKQYGIARHVRIARERLAALGDRGDLLDADAVRNLLERLDDLAPGPRQRLLGAIESLTSAGGREAEAGTILRDYYVKKVGSQEVVAERHYLTRPTFYRRLHLGWELLAERLGSLDETPVASAPGS